MSIAPKPKFTLDEFKAWFDGFGEAIETAPSPEQWAKIQAKVADIASATTYTGVRSRSFGDSIDDYKRQLDGQRGNLQFNDGEAC